MIDPLSLGLMAAGTAMSVSASRQQGKLAMQSARHNAGVLESQNEQDKGATLEGMARRRIENNHALSSVRNRLQGTGIDTTQGSTSDYLDEATGRMELQILDEARQQSFRATARENQQSAEIYQGNIANANAKATSTAQLIQGGARIAGQAFNIKQHSRKGEFMGNAFGLGGLGRKWF